jgi:hypothetical protein
VNDLQAVFVAVAEHVCPAGAERFSGALLALGAVARVRPAHT